MGLDMYLAKKTFIGGQYEHRNVNVDIDITKKGKKVNINPERITYIEEHVAYWRKANQIHKWFVDNCQEGIDDCRSADVTREQLETLLNLCKEVKQKVVVMDREIENGHSYTNGAITPIMETGKIILNSIVCEELLPTQEGFLFGNTNYNNYYLDDIDNTIEQLEEILANCPEDDYDSHFIYTSSW